MKKPGSIRIQALCGECVKCDSERGNREGERGDFNCAWKLIVNRNGDL